MTDKTAVSETLFKEAFSAVLALAEGYRSTSQMIRFNRAIQELEDAGMDMLIGDSHTIESAMKALKDD